MPADFEKKFKTGRNGEVMLEKPGGGFQTVATVPDGAVAISAVPSDHGLDLSAGGIGFSVDEAKPDLQVSSLSAVHWQTGPDYQYPPIGQPIIVTGSYKPTGAGGAFVSIGFTPDFVIVKADATTHPVWRANVNWYGRSDYVTSKLSANRITSFRDGGFTVTADAEVGASGTTYYYLAIADNASGMLSQVNIFGNGITRTISGWLTSEPDLMIAKRDNANPMMMRFKGMPADAPNSSLIADGSGTGYGIQSVASNGNVALYADPKVNELNGPAGFGEACGFLAFYQTDFCQITSYVGDGTSSKSIALNFQPEAVLIVNAAGSPKGAQLALASVVSGKTVAFSNTPQQLVAAGRISLTPSGVTVNSDTGVNASGATYYVIAFKRNVAEEIREQKPKYPVNAKRAGILLSGAGSYIDCGTSDSLKLSGSCSVEWQGAVEWNSDVAKDIPLIMRANEDSYSPVRTGGASWGLTAYQRTLGDPLTPQSSVDYKGPTLRIVCSNWMDIYETGNSNPASALSWDVRYSPFNSGWVMPNGHRVHIVLTHTSPGLWRMYVNGVLYKERNINMVSELSAQNINSPSSQRTVIGARAINGGTQIINSARMLFERARIYSRALTNAEVQARYQRGFLGLGVADVTAGLVEEWDAAKISGTTLLATVSPENNGTIFGGSVVKL